MPVTAAKQVAAGPKPAEHDFMPALFGLEYSTYGVKRETFFVSFLLHTLLAAGLIVSSSFVYTHRQEIKTTVSGIVTDISPYILPPAKDEAGGGGGGGDRDKLQASKGNLPKLSDQQFTPPMVVVRNVDPKLPMEPTVVVPPQIPLPTGG